MINKIYFVLIYFIPLNILIAQDPIELFKEANNAYEKNNYKVAIETYEQILKNGYVSGELLYNLGNAYFKTGQFANSILNYERAKKYFPNDDDLSHNITIANLRIPDRIEKVPKLFILEWWEKIKNLFPLFFYQYFIFLLFSVFIFFVTLFFWSKEYSFRKKTFFVGLAFTMMFVFFTIAFITRAIEEKNKKYAVVFSLSSEIKSAPDENGTNLYLVHYGLKVEIIDELSGWIKVILPDGKMGWMKNNSVEII